MSNNFKPFEKSIIEQASEMRRKYPHFTVDFASLLSLRVVGEMRPTSRSRVYHFILKYCLTSSPKIKIVSPEIQKNNKGEYPPHLYPSENLCLYHPSYHEFNTTDFLSDTIIPWTSLWLYYYEVWHNTGKWLGGGEHPK